MYWTTILQIYLKYKRDRYIYHMNYRNKKKAIQKSGPHLFETDPNMLIEYLQIQKEERVWRNSGQYYMARECQRRSLALLNENIADFKTHLKTESLYCPTKKCHFDSQRMIY
jgi:hypothetical protein